MPTTNENEYAPDVAGRVRAIREATYGSQVREAIASSIEDMDAVLERDTDNARVFANNANTYAANASASARNAQTYANNASQSLSTLDQNVKKAESWANGNNLNINPAAENNNAYYFAQQAQQSAADAAVSESNCMAHVESVVSGVAEWGPSNNRRAGAFVEPEVGDYDASMIINKQNNHTVEQDLALVTKHESAYNDIHNFANVDIDTPVSKCYGVYNGNGTVGLQSMCVRKETVGSNLLNVIYCYSGEGKLFKIIIKNDGTHTKSAIDINPVIDKGNGMCSHDGNFYFIGKNTAGTDLRSIITVDSNLTQTKVDIANQINGIDFKDVDANDHVHLYGYGQDSSQPILRFWDIDTVTGDMTKLFILTFPEARNFDQDMMFSDGYFYIVSDYHGCLLKVSLTEQTIKKCIRLGEYCDNGIYTGEYEGVALLDGKILMASTFTGYLESEPETITGMPDVRIPTGDKESISLRRTRSIIFTILDLDKNIDPYSLEMRGSLASQFITRHINWNKNNNEDSWIPDGSTAHPYPTPAMAFSAYQNPRHRYTFVVDKPYVDGNNKPFMVIVNQHDVNVHLTSDCANIVLFVIGSRITLSSTCNFKIGYLMDSVVNYISDPTKCLSVKNYTVGHSKFNCNSGNMVSPFGSVDYSPKGNYRITRTWGDSSDNPSADVASSTVRWPAGNSFTFNIKLQDGKGTFFGTGIGTTDGGFRMPVINSGGTVAMVYLQVTNGMQYISQIKLPSESTVRTAVKYAKVEVSMS